MDRKIIIKVAGAISNAILKIMAVILFFGAVVVLARGYMKTSNGNEGGLRMYALVLLALIYSGILWRWSRHR